MGKVVSCVHSNVDIAATCSESVACLLLLPSIMHATLVAWGMRYLCPKGTITVVL